MNELTGMLCLGGVFLAPLVMFVLGYLVGRNKLPYTIKIERNKKRDYVVEDGTFDY